MQNNNSLDRRDDRADRSDSQQDSKSGVQAASERIERITIDRRVRTSERRIRRSDRPVRERRNQSDRPGEGRGSRNRDESPVADSSRDTARRDDAESIRADEERKE